MNNSIISKKGFVAAMLLPMLLLCCPVWMVAQDYSKTNLHMVYIDHETSTPATELCLRLRTLRNDAIEIEDALIVYLADGRTPHVSLTGLPDATGQNRNKEEAIYEIFEALQNANSHSIIVREDRHRLLQLFDEFNFVDDKGALCFNRVTIDFYVGPSFWALGYEKLISHLFVALGVAQLPRDRFAFNIFKPKGTNLGFPEGKPFGEQNVDGINQKLNVLEY